jgi:hypothetical protein
MKASGKSADWLATPSAYQWLFIASLVSIGAAVTEAYLAASKNTASIFVNLPDWTVWLAGSLTLLAFASQLFVLAAMLLYTLRHPEWKRTTKLVLVLLQVFLTIGVSLPIYFLSYRPRFKAVGGYE